MDYFNPFMRQSFPAQQALMPTQMPMPMPTQMPMQRQALPPIDQQQFRQFAITLNDNALNNFAQMARQQGISETDIQAGINFIKTLR